MEDGCVRYPGSPSTICDQLPEGDCSRNLEILVIQPWTGSRERETERELRNRLLLPRANALRNAYNMPPFLSCLKPLFQSEVKWEAIDMKMIFTLKQISLIFTRKVLHWASFWEWEFVKLGNSLCPVGSLKAARWRTGLKTTVVRSATRGWQQRAEGVRKWRVSDAPSQSLPLLPLSLISNNLFFE